MAPDLAYNYKDGDIVFYQTIIYVELVVWGVFKSIIFGSRALMQLNRGILSVFCFFLGIIEERCE